MRVSIVVPALNEAEGIADTLRGLQQLEGEKEIIAFETTTGEKEALAARFDARARLASGGDAECARCLRPRRDASAGPAGRRIDECDAACRRGFEDP